MLVKHKLVKGKEEEDAASHIQAENELPNRGMRELQHQARKGLDQNAVLTQRDLQLRLLEQQQSADFCGNFHKTVAYLGLLSLLEMPSSTRKRAPDRPILRLMIQAPPLRQGFQIQLLFSHQ